MKPKSANANMIPALLYFVHNRDTGWVEVAEMAKITGIKIRTAHTYIRQMVEGGILEVLETYPANIYRLSSGAKDTSMYRQLMAVAEARGEA